MTPLRRSLLGALLKMTAVLPFSFPSLLSAKNSCIVYVGTYTKTDSKGIYAFSFDPDTGRLHPLGLAGEAVHPSFLAIHPNGRYLYAVQEAPSSQDPQVGLISAFSIDPQTYQLTPLGDVSSAGDGPCYLHLDHSGRFLLTANYGSGSVVVFPILADGRLGEPCSRVQHQGTGTDPVRQKGPHAHSIRFSPDQRFVLSADLGLDKLMIYRFDRQTGALTANDPPHLQTAAGAGPRHFAFSSDSRFLYLINELNSTLVAVKWDRKNGRPTVVQTIPTLPPSLIEGNSTAEVQVHPNGRFVYGSNRGHDSIVVFRRDRRKGVLTLVEHVSTRGKTPRHFAIDPSGKWLIAANQNSDSISVFRIDLKTGRLTAEHQPLFVSMPVCILFAETK
ncbi:MAG TPA: lactonase family protein [bacterium]|nr:lactonase family protein [bacterium]